MGLYYSLSSKSGLVGYADAGLLSDPHNGRSQTGYVFLYVGTAISWRSTKQTIKPHHQTMQKFLQFMKQAENVFGLFQ